MQLVDDQYVCSLKDGSEINVSERVFAAMSDDLDQMNTSIRKNKEKGANLVIFKPDAKYLNLLLDVKIYSNSDSQKTDIEFVKARLKWSISKSQKSLTNFLKVGKPIGNQPENTD